MNHVSSWGRLPTQDHQVVALVNHPLRVLPMPAGHQGLAHGMGRSYGDVCLNPGGTLWTTTHQDRLVDWNPATGLLTCEAGVLLRDIQRLFVPRGWTLPVLPGTQFVTVGGAIANDVHGKNQHVQGTFGDHVQSLRLLRTDGQLQDCGPDLEPERFAATVGGLGLTGVITHATLALQRVHGLWLETEHIRFEGIGEFLSLADASVHFWEHTVAWIDSLSGRSARGIFRRANPASGERKAPPPHAPRRLPFHPPFSLVNRHTVRAFNAAHFHLNRRRAKRLVHRDAFFNPLDACLDWNRLYGSAGFYQYQCVVPRQVAQDALQAMLGDIRRGGEASCLSVLKTFGDRAPGGMLSFVQPGVTLALDFPNRGATTLTLFERLDAIVQQAGGRLYPAKDARMPRDLFEASYPLLPIFLRHRDPGISSAFSRRTMGR
ncbi:FAD-dependent oxidoreductase [Variovorax sp. N23]|uniref:FAD-binding oxidoreductase n=1 Tax=Variovorax sp. N23 TaxID=2980555 RepID=UPI0021C980FD|nr:FAD-binding oxidoreductase [Variovorax sp. N23]MCU4121176.1 FAD-binding oxidoreductase [Variovorax sp. N23]